jgi:hypothetical protein
MTDDSGRHVTVGSIFPMLAILAGVAVVFVIMLLALGDTTYALAAGVLFGLLVLAATGESLLARHQAAAGGDGPFPVMAVDLADPFSMEGDLPE